MINSTPINPKYTLVKLGAFLFLLMILVACQEEVPGKVAKAQALVEDKLIDTTDTATQLDSMTSEDSIVFNLVMDSTITQDYLMGKFEPAQSADFVKVEKRYASRPGFYLRKETYEAFKKMHAAAAAAGVQLTIKSATRNFASQKRIWEAKWTGKRLLEGGMNAAKAIPAPKDRALKILEWSSMPGSSRHHWGTDLDLNAFVNSYFEKGRGLKEYEWLQANAADFGFCQPYSPKGQARPFGYNEEKWHWSYLPLAKKLSDQCRLRLKDEHITGFEGAEVAGEIEIVKKYVLGINQACL